MALGEKVRGCGVALMRWPSFLRLLAFCVLHVNVFLALLLISLILRVQPHAV